jgi:probable rRNA maturation factor
MAATAQMTRPSTRRTRTGAGRRASIRRPATATIDILPAAGTPDIDPKWLRDRVRRAAPLLGRPVARVSVAILDDAAMKFMHSLHLGINSTTDVLTFPAAVRGPIEADIAVCADVAARRAADLDHPVERELLLYIIHGLLHCCGENDDTPAAARRMHAREDRILEAIGVGATFANRDRAGRRR